MHLVEFICEIIQGRRSIKHKNTRVTWQGTKYMLPEDDKNSVETCRSVIICEINVHELVIVQNNKRCMVQLLK